MANEAVILPILTKLQLIRSLIDAGHTWIQVTGFGSPRKIPQLADADDLARQLPHRTDVIFSAWVGDSRGMERAISAGVDEVVLSVSASEAFQKKVSKITIAERFDQLREMATLAGKHQIRYRGSVSTAFYCPLSGKVDAKRVLEQVNRLLDLGCSEVTIQDNVGRATPKLVWKLLDRLLRKIPAYMIAGRFHDTYGMGISNVLAALASDVRVFESSIGGLGLSHDASGGAGNVATEDLVHALEGMGVRTNVSLDKLVQTTHRIERFLNHPIASKVYQAEKNRL